MTNSDTFYIEKEGQEYQAKILTNFEIYGDHYCIYALPQKENNDYNLYCAKWINHQLEKIKDQKELDLTNKIVKQFTGALQG